jgi:3-phytase
MHNIAYAVLLMAALPLNAAPIARVEAVGETTPIPAGEGDTDDPVIWVNKAAPEKSLILGTSKYGENGQGGLGVYNLQGQELQFLGGSKLNNVDLDQDLAIATNRSLNALDFYTIEDGVVSFSGRVPLFDQQGQSFEPYGLCLSPQNESQLSIFLPTKTGTVYHYKALRQPPYTIDLMETIDIGSQVSVEQDALIRQLVRKEVNAEGDEDELEEKLQERFILEACVSDPTRKKVYVGMENLGIWSLDLAQPNHKPKLLTSIQGSWTDIDEWGKPETPRITDDIEGMDVIQHGDQSYLLFSSQGISEFSLFDLQAERWVGNFEIGLNPTDPITLTDGLAVVTQALGSQYPEGILVVHDDQNTDVQGEVKRANYKIVSLADVWRALNKE